MSGGGGGTEAECSAALLRTPARLQGPALAHSSSPLPLDELLEGRQRIGGGRHRLREVALADDGFFLRQGGHVCGMC